MEVLPPIAYLAPSYYQRWFLGLEKRVSRMAWSARTRSTPGTSLRPGRRLNRKLTVADARSATTRGNFERPAPAPAKFKAGDKVRTRNINPTTHTRLPRYARGKLGTVEAVRGCHVYPDTAALGDDDHPNGSTRSCSPARELWGEEADPSITVSIEAFEPYLEPA